MGLYEKSPDLNLRALIVERLAGIATPGQLPFFVSLVPGHSSPLDDRIRVFAVLGIGRIGRTEAVAALKSIPRNPNREVRSAVAQALGNTKSPAAVPVLIGMRKDLSVYDDVCWALATLTHRNWCESPLPDIPDSWPNWWRTHAAGMPIYGTDECPTVESLSPLKN
jgi:HEAT repeat protein